MKINEHLLLLNFLISNFREFEDLSYSDFSLPNLIKPICLVIYEGLHKIINRRKYDKLRYLFIERWLQALQCRLKSCIKVLNSSKKIYLPVSLSLSLSLLLKSMMIRSSNRQSLCVSEKCFWNFLFVCSKLELLEVLI